MTEQWQPAASIGNLKRRAQLINNIRSFFAERGVMEVETPSISRYPTLDLHLESFGVNIDSDLPPRYLITSPEYHMKRLIAAGSGSIYQICKSFRCDEVGAHHNPEFTILEWYRVGWNHLQLMEEIEGLMMQIMGTGKATRTSYREIFRSLLQLDPLEFEHKEFKTLCQKLGAKPPQDLLSESASKDECLNYLMGSYIEPQLGRDNPVFVCDFPASQASLSRIHKTDPRLSTRFEVYYKGIELGNGFYELTDAGVQEKRFRETNTLREQMGKARLHPDRSFLAALEQGMPDCAGVAMGLDRMLMLAMGQDKIERVMSFTWNGS